MRRSLPLLLLGGAALALAAAQAGAPAPAPGDDRFGVMTHFAHGWDPAWAPLVARASVSQVRDELYWATVERAPGVYSFPPDYDRYMDALNRNGVAPLVVLSFENPLYDGGDTPHSDAAIAAYARYAVAVLRHYGSQIKAVEIWNEYNGTFNHGPATQDRAGTYLRMLRAAYTAIKRERPDVLVAGGATSGIPLPYWKKLLAGGALDCLDALSVHPYRYDSPPEGIEDEIAALQALEPNASGKSKPIWVTEIGWFTKPAATCGDLAIDEPTQAKFLVRSYALLLSADVQRVFWYLLHDDQGLNMGLFRDDAAHTAKPASRAYATLVEQLRAARFVRRDPTRADFYSLVFAPATGPEVHLVWSLHPTRIAVSGPATAVDYQGRPIALAGPLEVDDAPVFVRGTLAELPPPIPAVLLADSHRDFSVTQGDHGWYYGALPAGATTWTALRDSATSDWATSWTSELPYLSVTATDQHPSAVNGTPVAAVRRWRSDVAGPVRIVGRFRCNANGDGVGVGIAVDGHPRFRKLLGGGNGRPTVDDFDFVETVQPGTTIDFAVDPGPAANIDYDATAVAVTITKASP